MGPPHDLTDVVTMVEEVIAGERRRIEEAAKTLSFAQDEVDKWLPLLKALQAYDKVGPVDGEDENAALWDPIYYTVAIYGEARGLWELPTSGRLRRWQSAWAGGSTGQAGSRSAGSQCVGPMPPAPHSGSAQEAPMATAGADEAVCLVPPSPSELETPSAAAGSSRRPLPSAHPDGRRRCSASTRLTNVVAPAPDAVGSQNAPDDCVFSTAGEEEASAAACEESGPVGDEAAGIAASSGSGSRPGSTDTAVNQAYRSLPVPTSPLPESQALNDLKELLAARCCHRVAASGLVAVSLGAASGATSGAEQGGEGGAETGMANSNGPSRLARLMDTDEGRQNCIVLNTVRTFIIAVQILDGISTKRMSGLKELYDTRGDAIQIISVLNVVRIATSVADALDVWSIAKLKEREASRGSRN